VRPEGLGKFKNSPHRVSNSRPSGLYNSALTTTQRISGIQITYPSNLPPINQSNHLILHVHQSIRLSTYHSHINVSLHRRSHLVTGGTKRHHSALERQQLFSRVCIACSLNEYENTGFILRMELLLQSYSWTCVAAWEKMRRRHKSFYSRSRWDSLMNDFGVLMG
jgi:hypothetical protein